MHNYMDGVCMNIYIYIYVVHELNILRMPNIVICHDLSIFQQDFTCCIFVSFFSIIIYIYIIVCIIIYYYYYY